MRGPLLWIAVLALALFGASLHAFAKSSAPKPTRLGPSVIALYGPWKFSIGDDPSWASLSFKDAKWESVDLTPAPGARDADVGLKGYTPGWGARGHKNYAGFAWYRLRVSLSGASALAIAGPPAVDGAYQLFADGALLGGLGNFHGAGAPTVHGEQPRLFQLPSVATKLAPATNKLAPATIKGRRTVVLAMRVWTPAEMARGDGGGVHVAPIIGQPDAVAAIYQGQWLQTFKGYVVDAVEPVAFLVLTCMALALFAARRSDPAYVWLGAALFLTALSRANQVFFFLTQAESLEVYGLLRYAVLAPLTLVSWVLAWWLWLGGKVANWLAFTLAGVMGLYMVAALGALPWVAPIAHGFFQQVATGLRIVLAGLYFLALGAGLLWKRPTAANAFACLTAVIAAVGLFAEELTMLGVKGIWFPFGVGVSRTEYAYAVLIVALFALILERFVSLAQVATAPAASEGWGEPPPASIAARAPPPLRQSRARGAA